jgi:hypothetical protein
MRGPCSELGCSGSRVQTCCCSLHPQAFGSDRTHEITGSSNIVPAEKTSHRLVYPYCACLLRFTAILRRCRTRSKVRHMWPQALSLGGSMRSNCTLAGRFDTRAGASSENKFHESWYSLESSGSELLCIPTTSHTSHCPPRHCTPPTHEGSVKSLVVHAHIRMAKSIP